MSEEYGTSVMDQPVDVNQRFADERASQIQTAQDAQASFERRVEAGTLVPLGDGRFRVNDPGSWDNGEIWVQREGRAVPQHGLDLKEDGTAALYSTVPAWHGLGSVIPSGTSSVDEVLALSGLDFDVVKRPVMFSDSAGDPQVLSDQFVNVRRDTDVGLGVVGKKYQIIQNRDNFTFLQDLVDDYGVIWESAGPLRGGRKVFVSMRLPQTVTIDAEGVNDQIIPFLVAINSHDGSSLAQVVITPWRPVCGNTERFAIRDAHTRWGIRHTRNYRDRVDEARRALGLTIKYYDRFKIEEESLARTDLALDEFHSLADSLWSPPAADAPQIAHTKYQNRMDTLTGLYDSNATRLGLTAYAGERAITEYVDWKATIRPSGSLKGKYAAARATAVIEGAADDVKSKAHRQLLTLVKR